VVLKLFLMVLMDGFIDRFSLRGLFLLDLLMFWRQKLLLLSLNLRVFYLGRLLLGRLLFHLLLLLVLIWRDFDLNLLLDLKGLSETLLPLAGSVLPP